MQTEDWETPRLCGLYNSQGNFLRDLLRTFVSVNTLTMWPHEAYARFELKIKNTQVCKLQINTTSSLQFEFQSKSNCDWLANSRNYH